MRKVNWLLHSNNTANNWKRWNLKPELSGFKIHTFSPYYVHCAKCEKCPSLCLTGISFPSPSQVLPPSPNCPWSSSKYNISLKFLTAVCHSFLRSAVLVTYVLNHELFDTRVRVSPEAKYFAPSLHPVSPEAEQFAPSRYLIKSLQLNRGSLRSHMENSVQCNPGIIYLLTCLYSRSCSRHWV